MFQYLKHFCPQRICQIFYVIVEATTYVKVKPIALAVRVRYGFELYNHTYITLYCTCKYVLQEVDLERDLTAAGGIQAWNSRPPCPHRMKSSHCPARHSIIPIEGIYEVSLEENISPGISVIRDSTTAQLRCGAMCRLYVFVRTIFLLGSERYFLRFRL